MHITSAFGLVYLTEWLGHYGVWIIALPTAIAFIWGVRRFEKPDKKGTLPNFAFLPERAA
jgi:hypothetical protein